MADSTNNVPSAFKANNRWICENIEKLRQQYNNQWVAVHNQTVVDSGLDLKKLVDRLKAKHTSDYAEIAVEFITTGESEEEPLPSDYSGP
jgi:hypothetical protein